MQGLWGLTFSQKEEVYTPFKERSIVYRKIIVMGKAEQ